MSFSFLVEKIAFPSSGSPEGMSPISIKIGNLPLSMPSIATVEELYITTWQLNKSSLNFLFLDKITLEFHAIELNSFSILIGLQKNQINGIDIQSFHNQEIEPVPGFIYASYDGYKIPYPDNTFDLITCSMVLHHVQYPNILINEMKFSY